MSTRRNSPKILKILCAIILTVTLSLPASHVYAVSGDGLAAYPSNPDPANPLTGSWFIYSLDRGQSKKDSLTIKNDSDKTQTIKIYPVDATTNNVGEFALETESDSRETVGKWITLETNSVTLAPGEAKQVEFAITIPQNAASGETSGGIIIERISQRDPGSGQSGFIINTRLGIRVYETVPGEVIRKVSFGDSTLEYDKKDKMYTLNVIVKNESSISLEPDLKVDIKDTLFGTQNQQLQQKTMIPREGQVKATFTFKEPKVGKFEITPEATYEKADGIRETVVSSQKLSFWALPWDEIIIAGLLILANLLFLAVLHLLARKERKYYKSYRVRKEENLGVIARKLGTDWKKIAKINKMKAPYQLEEGQIITVFDKKDMLEQLYMENERITNSIKETTAPDPLPAGADAKRKIHKKSVLAIISAKLGLREDIFLLIILALGLIAGAYALYTPIFMKKNNLNFTYENPSHQSSEKNEIDTSASLSEDNESEQTIPEDELLQEAEEGPEDPSPADRENVKIEILNGSGIKGASLKISAALASQGYQNISTGNADNFNYTDTLLGCSASVAENICGEIESLLLENYEDVQKISGEKIKTDSIRIILGR